MGTAWWWLSLVAWVLWSNVSDVGPRYTQNWSQRRESWSVIAGTTTEGQCRSAEVQMLQAIQSQGIPITDGVMQNSGDGIRRITYRCLPESVDPRARP